MARIRHVIVVMLVISVLGCAAGRVQTGEMAGIALGHAKLEQCVAADCQRIEGGALSGTFVEALGVIGAAAAAFFASGLVF